MIVIEIEDRVDQRQIAAVQIDTAAPDAGAVVGDRAVCHRQRRVDRCKLLRVNGAAESRRRRRRVAAEDGVDDCHGGAGDPDAPTADVRRLVVEERTVRNIGGTTVRDQAGAAIARHVVDKNAADKNGRGAVAVERAAVADGCGIVLQPAILKSRRTGRAHHADRIDTAAIGRLIARDEAAVDERTAVRDAHAAAATARQAVPDNTVANDRPAVRIDENTAGAIVRKDRSIRVAVANTKSVDQAAIRDSAHGHDVVAVVRCVHRDADIAVQRRRVRKRIAKVRIGRHVPRVPAEDLQVGLHGERRRPWISQTCRVGLVHALRDTNLPGPTDRSRGVERRRQIRERVVPARPVAGDRDCRINKEDCLGVDGASRQRKCKQQRHG